MKITDRLEKRIDPKDYVPTKREQALLNVLLDPYHRMASVSQQCKLAECSRDFFYVSMKKESFMAYYALACREMIKSRSAELVNIGIREARRGGSAGFGYWRELSKMAGLIEDENVKANVDVELEIRVSFVAPNSLD